METVTATEAARLLRVADKTIRDWLRKGRFPGAQRVKRNGIWQWSIPLADIEAVRIEEEKTTESSGGLPMAPEVLSRLEALERRVEELERANQHKATGTTSPLPALKLHKQSSDDLPSHLVTFAQFAQLHGIAISTVRKAIDSERLPAVHGQWKQGRAIVKTALDANGRARFYELFHNNEHFVRCESCPHLKKYINE